MAFSHCRENQSAKKQIKCVISRTSRFLAHRHEVGESLCYYPGVGVRTWWKFLFQILYLSYYFAKLAWIVHLHLIMDLKDLCLFVIFSIYIMIEYCILFLCSTYYCITLYLIIWCSSIQCCVIWYNIV